MCSESRDWAGCRALRVVNPSPYMIYLQARGSILVASSPEILCHVSEDRTVTNRSAPTQLPAPYLPPCFATLCRQCHWTDEKETSTLC